MCRPNLFSMSKLRSTVRELCLYFVGIEATRSDSSGPKLRARKTAMGRPGLVPADPVVQARHSRVRCAHSSS